MKRKIIIDGKEYVADLLTQNIYDIDFRKVVGKKYRYNLNEYNREFQEKVYVDVEDEDEGKTIKCWTIDGIVLFDCE